MKFTLKKYKYLKIKKSIKETSIIYFYNVKTNDNFIKRMQHFHKLEFNCNQITNSLMRKSLKQSIYSNYSNLITGLIMLVKHNDKIKSNNNVITFQNKNILLGIKMNNKFYPTINLSNNFFFLNYKQSSLKLLKLLKNNFKTVKNIRNNVI